MELFKILRIGDVYTVKVEPVGLAVVIVLLTGFGFVVHVADRLLFG